MMDVSRDDRLYRPAFVLGLVIFLLSLIQLWADSGGLSGAECLLYLLWVVPSLAMAVCSYSMASNMSKCRSVIACCVVLSIGVTSSELLILVGNVRIDNLLWNVVLIPSLLFNGIVVAACIKIAMNVNNYIRFRGKRHIE